MTCIASISIQSAPAAAFFAASTFVPELSACAARPGVGIRAVRAPIVFLIVLVCALALRGRTNAGGWCQSEGDAHQEMLRRAYEKLEKLRARYNRECGGSSAGSGHCKDLAAQIKELEEAIAGFTGREDGDGNNGAHGCASDAGAAHPDLGGIDLRNLQLVYVKADPALPGGLMRAFASPIGADPKKAAGISADERLTDRALLAGLLFPAEKFWVNLNPSEPNRIADADLGKTEVARVLLEADLRMKRDAAAITDPRASADAKAYWAKLRNAAGINEEAGRINQETRFWIVPGRILIASDETEAFLRVSDLDVRLESKHLEASGRSPSDPENSRLVLQKSDAIEREFVLPRLQERVNMAPEYRELRQVFAGLVIAAWLRQHARTDSFVAGVTASWMNARPGWTPRETWRDYRQSLNRGEYDFTEETTETRGNLVISHITRYFNGGVDFTRITMPAPIPLDESSKQFFGQLSSRRLPLTRGANWYFAEIGPLGEYLANPQSSSFWGTWVRWLVGGTLLAGGAILSIIVRLRLSLRRRLSRCALLTTRR
jgi:hypothetical protein